MTLTFCRHLSRAAEKLEACEASLSHGGRMGRFSLPSDKRSKDDQQLTKITRDSSSMAVEQIKGMTSQVQSAHTVHRALVLGI